MARPRPRRRIWSSRGSRRKGSIRWVFHVEHPRSAHTGEGTSRAWGAISPLRARCPRSRAPSSARGAVTVAGPGLFRAAGGASPGVRQPTRTPAATPGGASPSPDHRHRAQAADDRPPATRRCRPPRPSPPAQRREMFHVEHFRQRADKRCTSTARQPCAFARSGVGAGTPCSASDAVGLTSREIDARSLTHSGCVLSTVGEGRRPCRARPGPPRGAASRRPSLAGKELEAREIPRRASPRRASRSPAVLRSARGHPSALSTPAPHLQDQVLQVGR